MDASCEIEALEHVFDLEVSQNESSTSGWSVSLHLYPYTGEDDTIFVETGVVFHLDGVYPDSMPEIEFFNSKGLSDQRLRRLRQEAEEAAVDLVGEPVLMCMCMAARDALSHMNHPEGACPFCLESMALGEECCRGACFHGYHSACARSWWQWLVHEHLAAAEESKRRRATIGLGIVLKERDPRRVECPVCREPLPPECLSHLLRGPDEQRAGHPAPLEAPGVAVAGAGGGGGGSAEFNPELLAAVVSGRKARMRILEAQASRGGLIENTAQ